MKPRKLTQRQLRSKLAALAKDMERVGLEMCYYGGFSKVADKGIELQNAASIARGWIKHIPAK